MEDEFDSIFASLRSLSAEINVGTDVLTHQFELLEDFLGKLGLGVETSVLVEPPSDVEGARPFRLCYAKHDSRRWALYGCELDHHSSEKPIRGWPRWGRIEATKALPQLLAELPQKAAPLKDRIVNAHSRVRQFARSLGAEVPKPVTGEAPKIVIENAHSPSCGEIPGWAIDRPKGSYFGYFESRIAGGQWVLLATTDEVKLASGELDWTPFTLKFGPADWRQAIKRKIVEWPDVTSRMSTGAKLWLVAALLEAAGAFGRADAVPGVAAQGDLTAPASRTCKAVRKDRNVAREAPGA